MIKYNLLCNKCKNSFDSWFASSKEYEKLKRMELIECNKCHSKSIIKNLMSPNLKNTKKSVNIQIQKVLKKLENERSSS